jgi:hypothetical protein
MSYVTDLLFGSTSQAGEPRIDTASTMTPMQRQTLDELNAIVYSNLGQGAPMYQGDLAAGPTGLQNQTWDQIANLVAGGAQSPQSSEAISRILAGNQNVPGAANVPGYSASTKASTPGYQASGAVTPQQYDVGQFDPQAIQDWYKNALVTPAMKNWEQSVVPTIQEKFISQNAGSSGAANRAIAGSAANLMTDLNGQLANALYGEKQNYDTRKYDAGTNYVNQLFNSGLDYAGRSDTAKSNQAQQALAAALDYASRADTAGANTATQQFTSNSDFINRLFQNSMNNYNSLQSIPGLEGIGTQNYQNTLNLAGNAGTTQNALNQNQLTANYQQWLNAQDYNNPWLNLLNNALGQSAFENVVQPEQQNQGLLQTLLSGSGGQGIGEGIGSWMSS